ncbi:transporter substrate-binding domain-containing protein [Pseudoduganella eburnea]|uniref:Transporter substrate-binding domain-containing protein n=1 Tax=Massilia eburnea TaxID=1776165 RepID=A0A6L6QPT1_9BURK|nr:transporter substrate-binding domain-containing protein [Massilia eburnea]MTW13543.1 transporter substrate-binding domain-containing protein [Massilia eburnea]
MWQGLAVAGPAVRLASDEWPPYVSASLPDNGVSGAYASAVFARLGSALTIDYFPWKRTMEVGMNDARYAGLLAVWRTPQRDTQCHFSAPIGITMTVLAYLKEAPVIASTVRDLRDAQIGTVAGYSNGEEFDGLVRRGVLHVQEGVNDETNLRKLLSKRFDAMVIEKRVLRHLLASPHFTRAERERVASAENLFRERTVHICFQRTPAGLAQQRAFNDAAREFDLPRFERDYLRRLGPEFGGN